ncbi:hypothetical protein CEXT_782291 [Caerostris extrusa]|uniref:Uncharacterized protein n=1 Tax=Caerostris extrusa TaxID=172846 RepID=A0AAV4Q1K1_CAEEX|nr:hypothetical protein CEXT_782291 [Caerostris extrusa]
MNFKTSPVLDKGKKERAGRLSFVHVTKAKKSHIEQVPLMNGLGAWDPTTTSKSVRGVKQTELTVKQQECCLVLPLTY